MFQSHSYLHFLIRKQIIFENLVYKESDQHAINLNPCFFFSFFFENDLKSLLIQEQITWKKVLYDIE